MCLCMHHREKPVSYTPLDVYKRQVLGMVRQWQTAFYGKRYSSTDPPRKTNYVKLAEGFGAKGYHC